MIVNIITFFLRNEDDLLMADYCFSSLEKTKGSTVILFNQGYLNNEQLSEFLGKYKFKFHVLGSGQNEGIAKARQICIEYVWKNIPECRYIAELHVDMIFPVNWHQPLVTYLENHDEPLICPGIITRFGEIHPIKKKIKSLEIPQNSEAIVELCNSLREDTVCEGFTSPVVFNNEILRNIGGYDIRFLKGKQAYEDDSILLGFSYYMGLKSLWKPKCYLASYVYHATLAQRVTVHNTSEELMVNLNGLLKQYGAYGLLQLAEIHGNENFLKLAESVISSG